MNGDRPMVNGERIPNGVQHSLASSTSDIGLLKEAQNLKSISASANEDSKLPVNGQHVAGPISGADPLRDVANGLEQASQEILQLVPKDSYLPMAALISRTSQMCWNGLSNLVGQLAEIQVPQLPPEQTKTFANNLPNNQTKANLDKKDRLLKFANEQKADFIKLLVLLDWSKHVDQVSKTISINFWLMRRRQAYWNAISSLALLKQDSAGFQVPNPDLKVAAEVLSKGKVAQFPTLGYISQKDLSTKQIVRLLRNLDHALSVKLSLATNLPSQLRCFRVHDGRATFTVSNEFELDVSILSEAEDAQFRMVDFRFAFSPAPAVNDALHSEIERLANSNIDRDGLNGCYLFLHELTLSYKLAEYHRQALELSRGQWAGNLRVEMIRRNLVIQYWTERQSTKSWIEFGISSGTDVEHTPGKDPVPSLEVKWMRNGKKVDSLQLWLDDSRLSFEDILRQVIAQHSTQLLDSIYDKLILAPLFGDGELALQQDASEDDPDECSLTMQLSQKSQLSIKVDAVSGNLVVSPVSERSERLQYEINRVYNVADEVVSKLLNFRCSVMEAAILAAIAGTSWESLPAFRLTQAEIKTLFGPSIIRINLVRQVQWGLGFFLVVTHGQNGDKWWLLQRTSTTNTISQAQFHILSSQKIEVEERLCPAYFERLAEYATGVICLQRNVDFLRDAKTKFDLPPFPIFEQNFALPELTFELDMSKPTFADQLHALQDSIPPAAVAVASPTSPKRIRLRFGGVDRATDRVLTIARIRDGASKRILHRLDKSMLGDNVDLDSKSGTLTIRVQNSTSEAAVPAIVDKAMNLEKSLAIMEQVYRLPALKLKAISNSSFTISYHHDGPTELGVTITVGPASPIPQLEFYPPDTNPHVHLAPYYPKLFQSSRVPFSTKVGNFMTSLILTYPMVEYLQGLQKRHGLDAQNPQPRSGNPESDIRVHVLVRGVAAWAVQYFTTRARAPADVGTQSQPHLLARLEIVQHISTSDKPMWLVRAALEDFQSYSRPSYVTQALRIKLRQEIFARSDNKSSWLALDNAAACVADKPEPLLSSIHDVMCAWVKQPPEPIATPGQSTQARKQSAAGQDNVPNGTSRPKAAGKQQTGGNGIPNGPMKQRPSISNSIRGGKGSSGISKNSEVITLD
ncbi:mediator complex subunit [Exophiala oligosperma]